MDILEHLIAFTQEIAENYNQWNRKDNPFIKEWDIKQKESKEDRLNKNTFQEKNSDFSEKKLIVSNTSTEKTVAQTSPAPILTQYLGEQNGEVDHLKAQITHQEEKFNTVKTFFQSGKRSLRNGKVILEFSESTFNEFERKNCSIQ